MKKRKPALTVLCVIAAVILVCAAVFLILSGPKRVLSRVIGIEPTEKVVLRQKDRDVSGTWVSYSYELEFGADEYEEVLRKLCEFYGGEYKAQSGDEYEHSEIRYYVEGSSGFPTGKRWFDPAKETVVWVHDSQRYNVLVSQDSEGSNHAYIQYDWTPLGSMIH